MMIAGFILSMLSVSAMLFGFAMPRYYDMFIPVHRQGEGREVTEANVDKEETTVDFGNGSQGEKKDDEAVVAVKRSEAEAVVV